MYAAKWHFEGVDGPDPTGALDSADKIHIFDRERSERFQTTNLQVADYFLDQF